MKTTNLQDRIKVCTETLEKVCATGISIELLKFRAEHSKNKEEIEKLEQSAKELRLIAELLNDELNRLHGVPKYSLN
jgi:hypothetical protein